MASRYGLHESLGKKMYTRIKICGITDPVQAVEVARAGAHAIGLVFAKSPRRVSMETARQIVQALPPMVQAIGVFVDEEPSRIKEIMDYCGLDMVQLHGNESPETCDALAPGVIKAVRIRTPVDLETVQRLEPFVRGFLLDTWSPKAMGGTGETFDWSIATEARRRLKRPVILAGGLCPQNVAKAIAQVRPWGVDVSSGVEAAPGLKDLTKVKDFIDEVDSHRF